MSGVRGEICKKLKEITPARELCEQIPQENFKDCPLVWARTFRYFTHEFVGFVVVPRTETIDSILFAFHCPAPTLEEILAKLAPDDHMLCNIFQQHRNSSDSMTTVALKFWLKKKGIVNAD